ncbi:uncharacterized protein BT62DRAFT_331329 [Guyanagaster necrorhizus]|uniref:DUF6534 domain-containing protein n=1 Tax=Guyanagaster necrorhizus TaxID=856835 RepID=A0A9P8AR18_9AGAR|nr:uncharacterized protein BT62DRAFT_331329 [Guyanagaster necrorhizus MCA 3950]KAG7443422.1 hypothetical protein BT62DRAFT_331329 [Guyanagaster necrorhizus MCA 3950]
MTSACSLLTLVSYIAWPDTLIFFAIGTFILPKLYINSLLAMLNSRKSSMWTDECHYTWWLRDGCRDECLSTFPCGRRKPVE